MSAQAIRSARYSSKLLLGNTNYTFSIVFIFKTIKNQRIRTTRALVFLVLRPRNPRPGLHKFDKHTRSAYNCIVQWHLRVFERLAANEYHNK